MQTQRRGGLPCQREFFSFFPKPCMCQACEDGQGRREVGMTCAGHANFNNGDCVWAFGQHSAGSLPGALESPCRVSSLARGNPNPTPLCQSPKAPSAPAMIIDTPRASGIQSRAAPPQRPLPQHPSCTSKPRRAGRQTSSHTHWSNRPLVHLPRFMPSSLVSLRDYAAARHVSPHMPRSASRLRCPR
jgi:hypothetical protein